MSVFYFKVFQQEKKKVDDTDLYQNVVCVVC